MRTRGKLPLPAPLNEALDFPRRGYLIPKPLKETDFLKVFALLMLCSVVGGGVAGGIVGAVVGLVARVFDAPIDTVRVVAPVLSGFAGVVATYFFFRLLVLRFIVRKLIAPWTDVSPHAT